MKKFLSIFLSISMLLTLAAGIDFNAFADNAVLRYNVINNNEVEVSGCSEIASGSVTIPSTYAGCKVTKIATCAFEDCASITSITIPDTVNEIGGSAFKRCYSLEKVNIPTSVVILGSFAFYECTSLKSITIPSVVNIKSNTFAYCENLRTAKIGDYTTSIGDSAFYQSGLRTVYLGKSIKTIAEYAFDGRPYEAAVTNVYYNNTMSQWKKVVISSKGNDWTIMKATIHCTDGVTNCQHDNWERKVKKAATTQRDGIVEACCLACGKIENFSTPRISNIKLSKTSIVYDGKAKTPAVTIKDSLGGTLIKNIDYTVSYASGRKNVGKYAVKITFKGDYSGTKTLYFTIVPKGTAIASVTPASKAMTVKWKKQATQTTGYQIQYATNSKFTSAKTVTVGNNKTVSKKITKLTGKKKYYVRVRTYKTVGSAKYYSAWSGAKAVTTKK